MKEAFKQFIRSGYGSFDLKYIFDHLRNIAISAAVIYAGVFLIENKEDASYEILKIDTGIIGFIIMCIGGLLALLNYLQLLILSNPSDERLRVNVPALLSLPIYFFSAYLLVVYIRSSS